jgi:hypothetical protein
MRCTYAAGLSSVGEFYGDRHAGGFESGAAVPGIILVVSWERDIASGACPVYSGTGQ